MDVNNLRRVYPSLISYFEENGYREKYIRSFKSEIRKILETGTNLQIKSYEDYYKSYLTKGLSTKALAHRRQVIGLIKQFDYQGKYPSRAHPYKLFQEKRYQTLSPDFMGTVDRWEARIQECGLKASSIATKRHVFVSFLSHLNSRGAKTFEEVTENMVLSYLFCHERQRGYMTCSRLKRIMKECLSYFSDKVYGKIFLYLPTIRNTRKNYPCLEEDETDKILSVLKDEFSNLNRRNRAIGLLALLCGIRSCDIANMKLADIDWDKETIRIVQQKTGIPLILPFCPLVGNIVYDYIMHERPKLAGEDHVFLINERETRHVSRHINHICERILAEAGIINREKTGFHLFRHRFSVMLLNKGVPSPVITAALGHKSPSSLDIYLDSDLIRLKECALSIEKFPIRKEVFL